MKMYLRQLLTFVRCLIRVWLCAHGGAKRRGRGEAASAALPAKRNEATIPRGVQIKFIRNHSMENSP